MSDDRNPLILLRTVVYFLVALATLQVAVFAFGAWLVYLGVVAIQSGTFGFWPALSLLGGALALYYSLATRVKPGISRTDDTNN